MKLKLLFWILLVFVFSSLIVIGFLFLKTDIRIFLVVEGLTLLSIFLFFALYKISLRPYKIISEGMDLLKQQDFSTRLRLVGHKETDRLIAIFNKMMDQLKEERLRVREQNRFLDLLINASPQGLIILDFDEKINQINPAGLRLLGLDSQESVLGESLEKSGTMIGKALSTLKPDEDIVLRISGITLYRCIRSSFIDRGFAHPFILIEELTHEILKIEKKSYENVIRMMAHEVNNSIAAVNSTLNVISDSLRENQDNELLDVLPAVDASFERCNHLNQFITNFANVVKIPSPVFAMTDLNELVRLVKSLCHSECSRRNIQLNISLSSSPCMVLIDGIQFEQVLVNLIKNAYESIGNGGEIRISTDNDPLQIVVEDNGPGFTEEVRDKLFTPFFTTKNQGQGIGLMFIREVLINHQCLFNFTTDSDGWTRFRINPKV